MSDESRTFVVGVDASDDADRALQWARNNAGLADTIVAVHAWDVSTAVGMDEYAMVPFDQLGTLAQQGMDELVERQEDPRLTGVAVQGHAGRAVVSEAEQRDADVVVVGHSGSGRASIVLGSTANHVIHHTERPVVVARGERRDASELIVVGVDDNDLDDDGENESVRALRWAYGVDGARIIIVAHSWFVPSVAAGPFSNPGADLGHVDQDAIDIAERVIAAAGEAPAGVDIRPTALRGTPEFALIEASRDADLTVVGSRGRGGFSGLVLGSTSLDLTSHAHGPVAIVR